MARSSPQVGYPARHDHAAVLPAHRGLSLRCRGRGSSRVAKGRDQRHSHYPPQGGGEQDRQRAADTEVMLKRLANVQDIRWIDPNSAAPPNALALVKDLKVMVPLAGLIDVVAEQARLDKEIGKAAQDLKRITAKLNNKGFVDKAPAAVVGKERDKATALRARIQTLTEQVDQLTTLGT